MINYKEFEVLRVLVENKGNISDLATFINNNKYYYVFKSIIEIRELIDSLDSKGYIVDGEVTKRGFDEISTLRVKNAIILAAGGNEISAKSVYSMPKGLYIKNNETLIERQIRQLKEAGIDDITVVVGYKQEMYFFLQDKWNVRLVVNPYLSKNNIYSLYMAADCLESSYICNCDNYFEKNPFSKYEYNSYHATVYKDEASNELIIEKNCSGRIKNIFSGTKSGECIYGHAYMDRDFSKRLIGYLKNEISDFRVSALFWEEFVKLHIEDLDLYVREYPADFLYEFDSIQEIQNIDSLFLENVSGKINKKICDVLMCTESDINNIEILQKGLTNILFTFIAKNEKYIFRYPGDSSTFFIYRNNECKAQLIAHKSGVDNTYVYIDESGIKISRFMEGCKNLNDVYYKDIELMKTIARKIRIFHNEGYSIRNLEKYEYNPIIECEKLMGEASKMKGNLFELFKLEWKSIRKIHAYTELDGIMKTMCHNDLNGDNCLVNNHEFNLIDWEFAGYNDPAYDFGRVIAGYDFNDSAIDEILEAYFGRSATELERLHWIAYIGIHNWYYVGWAVYKESINESSRDWMLFFYQQTKRVIQYVLPRYEEIYGEID